MTWDEALGVVAEKMEKIKAEYGPEAMALFAHGIGGSFLKHTLKATARRTSPRRPSRSAAARATSASASPSATASARPSAPTSRTPDCLVLIGSHLGENMHNTQVQEFAEAVGARRADHRRRSALLGRREQGEALAADQAGHRPRAAARLDERASSPRAATTRSTSGAYGIGFEQFAAEIKRPTRRSGRATETGIEAAVIRETAREMRQLPAGHPHPPRPPLHLVRRRHAAQPRHRAAQRAARELGAQGRLLDARPSMKTCPGTRLPKPTRSRRKRKVDNPEHAVPVRRRGDHHRHSRGDHHRQPVPDQGLDVYATNLMQRAAEPGGDHRGHPGKLDLLVVSTSCRARSPAGPTWSCPKPPTWSATTTCTSSWFRDPFVALRQPVVAPPGRPEAELVDRQAAGEQARASAPSCPWTTIEEYLDHCALERAPATTGEAEAEGVIIRGPKQPIIVRRGAAAGVRHAVGQDRVLVERLRRCRLRPGARSTRARGAAARRVPPADHRPRAGAHLQPHAEQPAPARHDGGERGLGEQPHVAARLGLRSGDYVRLRNQDGVVSEPVQGEGHRAHPRRTACTWCTASGTRRSPMLAGLSGRAPATRASTTRYAIDPLMGGTGMNEQLRHDRGGGVGHGALWDGRSTRGKCVGLHGLRRRLQDRERRAARADAATGSRRDARRVPDAAHGDPQRALQPLRQPAVRELLPDRREPRRAVRQASCWSTATGASAARPASPRAPTTRAIVHPDGLRRTSARSACTGCSEGLDPACVSVCPTHCMHFGDLDDPDSDVSRAAAHPRPQHAAARGGTKPRIFYLT